MLDSAVVVECGIDAALQGAARRRRPGATAHAQGANTHRRRAAPVHVVDNSPRTVEAAGRAARTALRVRAAREWIAHKDHAVCRNAGGRSVAGCGVGTYGRSPAWC